MAPDAKSIRRRLRALDRELFWERQRRALPAYLVIVGLAAASGWWNWFLASDRLARLCERVSIATDAGMRGERSIREINSLCNKWLDPIADD